MVPVFEELLISSVQRLGYGMDSRGIVVGSPARARALLSPLFTAHAEFCPGPREAGVGIRPLAPI
jgi:hypothetical protein